MLKSDRVFIAAIGVSSLWITTAYIGAGWLQQNLVRNIYLALPPLAALVVLLLPNVGLVSVLKGFVKAWCKVVCAYAAVVSVSAVLILLGCSAVGYLPYSDRPGPGWGNIPAHLPGFDEIRYFSEWAVFLLPMCYFSGSLLFVLMAWTRWLSAPTWLARSFGGLFSAAFGMIAVAAAGWIISISVAVSNGVGILCLLFGIAILPRVSPKRETDLSLRTRTIGIALGFLFITALLVYPFLR